jgi:hypothetical protein
MSFPKHAQPPSLQDVEAEIGAIAFALTRALPPGNAMLFIEGIQVAGHALADAGRANAGTYLQRLAGSLAHAAPSPGPGGAQGH